MDTKVVLGLIGAFVGGAAVGGLITYKVLDKKLSDKYEAFAQEQIDSVKEKFTVPKADIKKFIDSKKDANLVATHNRNKPDITEYKRKVSNYTNYSDVEYEKEETRFEPANKSKPVVIDPDKYGYEGDDGEFADYDEVSLTYYADGILADEDDTILNLDEVIGEDSVNHIGDYEDDAVHVRNDGRKVYYEVLVDERSYKEATGKEPHQDKDEED